MQGKYDKVYRFTQDYVFPSPSTAAGVVQGRSANGRLDWKTPAGQSLKDLQSPPGGGWTEPSSNHSEADRDMRLVKLYLN